MTSAQLPSARLDWVRCFTASLDDRAAILAQPPRTWQSDAASLLVLAGSHRDAGDGAALSLEYIDAAAGLDSTLAWVPAVCGILRSDALRALGRAHAATAALDSARDAISSAPLDLGDRIRLSGVVHVRAGLAAGLAGDLPSSLDELARGLPLLGELDRVRAEALGVLAVAAFLVGRIDDCRARLRELAALQVDGAAGTPGAVASALLAVEEGQSALALEILTLARPVGDGTEYRALLLAVEAVALEAAGELDDVTRALWELDAAAHPHDELARNLGLASWLAVQARRHQIAPALAALRDFQPDPAHTVCPAAWRARLYLETGDCAKALAATADCLALGPAHAMRTLVYVLAVTAAAHAGLRDTSEADAMFARVLDLAALTGLRRYIVTLPPTVLADLIARAAAADLPEQAHRVVVELSGMIPPEPRDPSPILSPRERLVLARLAEGLSLHVVAWQLSVSHNTVKSQARSIYRKLGVDSRDAAVERGRTLGFVD